MKKRVSVVLAVMCVFALTVGTLALFTDRLQTKTEMQAGTLDLTLTQDWAGDNTAVAAKYKPNTALKLNYTVANIGNIAADVKEYFAISTDKALNTTTPEFSLYKAGDITVDANGNVTAITGSPLSYDLGTNTEMGAITNNKLLFDLHGDAPYTLTAKDDGSDADQKESTYYLVLNTNVTNDFQEVGVKVELMAQALQDENTGVATWSDPKVIGTATFGGDAAFAAVPALN